MNDFTQGNSTRQIIIFSLPLLLGNLFQQMYNAIAAMVVGRYVGGGALAAVGISVFVINFLLAVMMGLTTGASVLISQFYGARQRENLQRTVTTSFILLVLLAIVISGVGVLFAPQILYLLDAPYDVFDDAVAYLRIMIGGTIFGMIYNLFAAYLRALGDTRRPLYILIFSCLLNLVFTLWFVLGLGMGVAGAAWATIIAQAFTALVIYIYVLRCAPTLKITSLTYDRILARSVLRYSVPTALQLSISTLFSLIFMRIVNSFGSAAAAGFTAALRIDQFVVMPINTLSLAISTFVAQNMGAGLEDRAKRGFRSSFLLGITMSFVISAIILLFGESLLALFVDSGAADAPAILQTGAEYILTLAGFYVPFAAFLAFIGFFRSVGDAVIAMVLMIAGQALRIVCSYIFIYFTDLGIVGLALSVGLGWVVPGLFSWYYYKRQLWRGKMEVVS